MKVVITAFALWALGSYGVYRLAPAPGWIVAYGLGTIALFAWLVIRANKKKA